MINNETILRFNKASHKYRTDSIKYRKLSADRVSELVAPASTDVILDIGCGTGTQLLELAKTIKTGIGIDISTGMIQMANNQLKTANCNNLEFYEGDFLTLDRQAALNDRNINKIISNYALHHLTLPDKKIALEKMIRIVGDTLEMIVIGDLMFFDEPEPYVSQYDQIGYGPGTDQPCYAVELAELLAENDYHVTLDRLHPLVGVLKAVKK